MRQNSLYYPHITASFRLFLQKIRSLKICRPEVNRNLMIFAEFEWSKVWTLQARILRKAQIYMASGVFDLGCWWLSTRTKGFGFVRSTKKETDSLLWCLSLFLVSRMIRRSNKLFILYSFLYPFWKTVIKTLSLFVGKKIAEKKQTKVERNCDKSDYRIG